jgi:hypothetical protein
LIIDKDGKDTNKTSSVIYKEVFRNISYFLLYENLYKFIVELMVNVTSLLHIPFNTQGQKFVIHFYLLWLNMFLWMKNILFYTQGKNLFLTLINRVKYVFFIKG